jgi:hypothetical protein
MIGGDPFTPEDRAKREAEIRAIQRKQGEDETTRPDHYGGESNPHEPIKVIEHYKLGFNLGNTVKYILRSPFKGATLADLKKARWYLDREIARMSGG